MSPITHEKKSIPIIIKESSQSINNYLWTTTKIKLRDYKKISNLVSNYYNKYKYKLLYM